MKALEKDRTRRYETANGLAMDVMRYLADEPVEACPPSTGYRLRKFARRNRGALTAALAFVLLLITSVVALTVDLVAVNRERQEKAAALEAEGNRRKQTRAALDAMSSQVIEDWLGKQPSLLPEHKQFLESALRYYEEFAADTGQQEESRAGVAHAYWRVGVIRSVLGQQTDAESAWDRSRELYAGLIADFPGVPAYRWDLSQIDNDLGKLYVNDRPREAEAALRRSVTDRRKLAAEFPDIPAYRHGVARGLGNLGILLKKNGEAPEAEEVFGQALTIHKQLVAEFPTELTYRDQLGQTYGSLGLLLYPRFGRSREVVQQNPERLHEASDFLAQAVDIYKQLAADVPTVARYRDQLATSRNNLGLALKEAGRYPEAEEVFRQALATRKQLANEFPALPNYRRGLAITLNNLGTLLKNTDRAPAAEEVYGQSLAIHKQLAADFPGVSDHQNEAAGASLNLSRLLLARKEFHAARLLLEEALPHLQAALKAFPGHPVYVNNYRLNRWRLTEALLGLKDHAGAAETAGQFLQAAAEPARDAYTAAGLLAGCVRLAGEDERLTETRRQELARTYGDRAVAALRQAIDKGAKEAVQIPKDPGLDPLRSRGDFQKLLADFGGKSKP
jgi:tetratricopeptide (TPR) repeat protein